MSRPTQTGATLIELLFVTAAIGVGLVGARYGGARWGPWGATMGFVAGFVLSLALGATQALLRDLLWSGIPAHPKACRSGRCRWEDLEIRAGGDDAGHFCRCGDRYEKRGNRWVQVLPDGTARPYVVWRAFRGWTLQ